METLSGEPAKGLLREIILSRPVCSDESLENHLEEYENNIRERNAKAKGDLEAAQNRILYLRKKEKDSATREIKGLGREHNGK
jgi:hypothetical protein